MSRILIVGIGIISTIVIGDAQAECVFPIVDLDKCPQRTNRAGAKLNEAMQCGPGDFHIPHVFEGVDFDPACAKHDACYRDCRALLKPCDNALIWRIKNACEIGLPGPMNVDRRNWCLGWVRVYREFVKRGGNMAYEDTQKKLCECCPTTKAWCPCNHKCYLDATSCQTDCHASMGCVASCQTPTPDLCPSP